MRGYRDTSQILIQLENTPNVFYQSPMRSTPNNFLARFTIAKVPPQPLATMPLVGHPPMIWEGLPTELGLRISRTS
jgi:hypothetical protein